MPLDIRTAILGWEFLPAGAPVREEAHRGKEFAVNFEIVYWDLRTQRCGRNSLNFLPSQESCQSTEKPLRDADQAWMNQGWGPVFESVSGYPAAEAASTNTLGR